MAGGFGRGPRPEEAGGRQAAKAVHHLGRARRRIRRPGRAPLPWPRRREIRPAARLSRPGGLCRGGIPRRPGGRRGPRTGWICGSGPDVALYVRRARAKKNSVRPLCSWMVRVYVRRARAKKEPRQKRGWWDKKLFIRDGVRPSPGLFSYKRRGRRDTPYGAYRRAPAPAGPVQSAPAPRAVRAPGPVGVWRRTACFPIRRLFGRRGFFRLAFVRGQFTLAAYFCRTLSICCVCAVSMGYQPFSDILL